MGKRAETGALLRLRLSRPRGAKARVQIYCGGIREGFTFGPVELLNRIALHLA